MVVANFLLHLTGGDNGSGVIYLELSGFIAVLGYLSLLGGFLRRHNCHQHRCWRLAKHPVADGSIVVCHKHHPAHKGQKLTAAVIHRFHHSHIEHNL